MRRGWIVLLILILIAPAMALDQNYVNVVARYRELVRKKSPDGTRLVSIVAIGQNVYMQERKFDPDTGEEVAPLLTAIDVNAFYDFKTAFSSFSVTVSSVNFQIVQASASIPAPTYTVPVSTP